MLLVTLVWMGELKQLDLLKLVLAKNSSRVFPRRAGFGPEAGGPGGNVNGQLFFRKRFVAMQIVKFDFGSRRKPEISVLDSEKVGGKFRKLPGAHEGSGVHQKWRQNLGV